MGTAIFPPLRCKEREPLAGLSFEGAVTWALRSEGCYDVREHVLDLVAHRKKDHDDDDRNEDEDQGVLNHSLAFLTGRKAAKLPVKAQHLCDFTSFFRSSRTFILLDGAGARFLRAPRPISRRDPSRGAQPGQFNNETHGS